MASVETTRVATERGSVRRADGRGAGRGDQARERDHSRRHERHGASHARVQSRRWPDPPATQASARRDAERARSGRRHLEGDAVSAWGFLPDALQFSLGGGDALFHAVSAWGFLPDALQFSLGGGDALFHAVSAWGFLPDAPDALSYPRPRAVPSRTRVRLGVSPQTTEPTRVTCATLRRVSRAR